MLFWDGTEITDFLKESRITVEEGIFEKIIYWKIQDGDKKEYCQIRFSQNILPCLIDELKPVFGLTKIGTHWIKYKGRFLILLKSLHRNDVVYFDLTLDKIRFNKN